MTTSNRFLVLQFVVSSRLLSWMYRKTERTERAKVYLYALLLHGAHLYWPFFHKPPFQLKKQILITSKINNQHLNLISKCLSYSSTFICYGYYLASKIFQTNLINQLIKNMQRLENYSKTIFFLYLHNAFKPVCELSQ